MKYLIFSFLFFICFGILKTKGCNKFIWLITGMLMINSMYSPLFKSNAHLTLSVFYAVSLIFDKRVKVDFQRYPLRCISMVILIIYLLIAVFTDWQPLGYSLYSAFLDYSISFLMLFAGFHAIEKHEDYDKILKVLKPIVLISSLYGIICYILKDNPYNRIIGISEVGVNYDAIYAIRGYRIAGFCNTSNPHAHLLTVCSFLVLNREKTKYSILLVILSFANILLSDSRAPISDLLVLSSTFFLFSKNVFKNTIKIVPYLFLLCGLLLIPSIRSVVEHTLANFFDVFSSAGANEVSGSSMTLRFLQFEAGWNYFLKHPILGHGFGYYGAHIYQDGTDSNGLWGMESYLLWLMVEMGALMMIAVLFYYFNIICFLLKNRHCSYYKVPLALTFMLISYLLLNRPTDIYEYTLPFIGVGIKMIFLYKENKSKAQYQTLIE